MWIEFGCLDVGFWLGGWMFLVVLTFDFGCMNVQF